MDPAHFGHDMRPAFAALMPPGSRVVVATSGGPDSQTLLDLASRLQSELGWEGLWAVGIDHQLRAAARDELQQAAVLAATHNVPFCSIAVHVGGGNILQAARRARYGALQDFARRHGATCIAVAHTATDQTETLLQNLCRGSGLRGAGGMRARRGMLVRPLLGARREQIEAYVSARQLPHARDPSNADPRRARARLRHGVLPSLGQINPRFDGHFASFALRAQADEAYLIKQARARLQAAQTVLGSLPLAALRRAPAVLGQRMLQLWLQHHGVRPVSQRLLESLWQARHQERLLIGQRPYAILLERGALWCMPAATPPPGSSALPIPGKIDLPAFGCNLIVEEMGCLGLSLGHFTGRDAESVAFDADRLHFGLRLRPWHTGDKLRPFGLNGHTKVSDLFTNAKVPRALRGSWPVVTDGESIVWVVGLRRSCDAPVNAGTRRIIRLKLDGKLDGALPRSAC